MRFRIRFKTAKLSFSSGIIAKLVKFSLIYAVFLKYVVNLCGILIFAVLEQILRANEISFILIWACLHVKANLVGKNNKALKQVFSLLDFIFLENHFVLEIVSFGFAAILLL